MSKYKIKHNKRKNTGLLYFAAIKRITEAACKEDKLSKKLTAVVVDIFRKEPLRSELEVYKGIVTEYLKPSFKDQGSVSRFIDDTLAAYKKLDQRAIDFQRGLAMKRISGLVPINELLKTKIDNGMYKVLTSVYVLVNSHQRQTMQETKDFVYICDKLVGTLVEARNKPKVKKDDVPMMSNLVLDFMVKRFNKKYGSLSGKQKGILREYSAYIMNEPGNKDFPLKMLGVVEGACNALNKFDYKDKAIRVLSEEAIKKTELKTTWDTEQLVTEALAYCEVDEIIKEPK